MREVPEMSVDLILANCRQATKDKDRNLVDTLV